MHLIKYNSLQVVNSLYPFVLLLREDGTPVRKHVGVYHLLWIVLY
jgi:hypothetical protein